LKPLSLLKFSLFSLMWTASFTIRSMWTLRTRTEMVFETLVSTKLNHLTRLITWENLIILSLSFEAML
jgi:hypothetical protein